MNDTQKRSVPAAALRCAIGHIELGDNGENAKSAPFRMVARTGDSIDHWFWGKVVHDLSGMRRHKDRLPIDYGHDDKEIIGYANRFESESGDLVVQGALVPYRDNDRASEIVYKSKQGVPYEASINFGGDGIVVDEYDAGTNVEVNGRNFSGPVTVIRQWPLRGIAVCPYGADANTSTNFESAGNCEVEVMKHELEQSVEAIEEENVAAEAAAVEADDAPNTVEAQEAVESESVVEEAPASETSLTGQDYLDRFGDQGGIWFAQGKDWDECLNLHEQKLHDRIAELESRLAAFQQGESEPLEFEPESQKKLGIAGRVRIIGRS
jgi:hypothetical protein